MKKLAVLLGTFLACGVVGCSADPNDIIMSETIAALRDTTNQIEQLSSALTAETAEAKKTGKPLSIVKIKKATEDAGDLKKPALRLQRVKAEIEIRKDNMTKDQREALASKYKADFQRAMADLDAAERKLDAALKAAEPAADSDGKVALDNLREKLKESQDEFEVLNKRQT